MKISLLTHLNLLCDAADQLHQEQQVAVEAANMGARPSIRWPPPLHALIIWVEKLVIGDNGKGLTQAGDNNNQPNR